MNNDDLEVNSQNFEVMNADINEERTPMPRSGSWHWVPGHVEVVGALGVGHAKIQADLVVLEWEGHRLKVREQADQGFFLGEAVFDDGVADQEGLDAGSRTVSHGMRSGSPQHRGAAARLEDVAEQGMGGADAAEVRGNFDELAAMRVELSRRHVDFLARCHRRFQDRLAAFLIRQLEPGQVGKEGGRGIARIQ